MNPNSPSPPNWADRLLKRLLPDDLVEELIGDLHEQFDRQVVKVGEAKARQLYVVEVLKFCRPYFLKRRAAHGGHKTQRLDYYPRHSFLSPDMIRSYLKIALRNLVKNKVYSFVNIAGLATGMGVAMLIGLWLYDELAFNTYHQNYDRIAQVKVNALFDGKVYTLDSHPIPLAGKLISSYGSDRAGNAGSFTHVVMATATQPHTLSFGDKTFTQSGRYMQADAPEMLTLKMVHGSRQGLQDVNAVMLSQSVADKLFGQADPINQIVKIDNKLDAKVTGVYEDLPHNSAFKDVTFMAPFDRYLAADERARKAQDDWAKQSVQVYVQLTSNADLAQVSAKIQDAKLRHVSGEQAARKPALFLHPMSQWHLYDKFENGFAVTSDALRYVWFYGIIGVFVLLLACINFMNLSTARSEKRAKEVGVRKVVGSKRGYLVGQFLSESILMATVAFLLSLGLVLLVLPWFNEVAGKQVTILWTKPLFWLSSLAFILLTGLLAGSYPALYLSLFDPIKVLKGTIRVGRLAAVPRKVLVVVQFTVSIALIIGTIVVYEQIQVAKNRPIGYERTGLLSLPKNGTSDQSDVFRNELLRTGFVEEVAESASPVTSIWSTSSELAWRGKDPTQSVDFGTISVTPEYGRTVGWQFLAGRDFSRASASDSTGLIANQAALKQMNLQQSAVGELIKYGGKDYRLLGVIKDMVMESPYTSAYPTVFFLSSEKNCVLIRLKPTASANRALAQIESVHKRLFPAAAFDYQFVDQEFAKKFGDEERISQLTTFFAVLTILISCLGLFGLASFMAEQRTKEIGVRKVLGASVLSVWSLLSKEFVLLVGVAFLIAAPIAYYFLDNWLQKYEYRTDLAWWIFALTGLSALAITLLTISFQSIKAALMNPVKSLRTE